MQVCTLLQTDNHTSTSPLSFLQAGCPSCRPTNSVKALKAYSQHIHDLQKSSLAFRGGGSCSICSIQATPLRHCHSLSLASVKSRLVLPFWYRLTRVVPEKGPLNVCVCVCGYATDSMHTAPIQTFIRAQRRPSNTRRGSEARVTARVSRVFRWNIRTGQNVAEITRVTIIRSMICMVESTAIHQY